MKKELKNQVILITGSSKGIGKALAINLGNAGAKIGLNGRNTEKLGETFKELTNLGIDCIMVPGDVTDYTACENIVRGMIDKYGRLDCLVANASMMTEAGLEEINPDVLSKGLDSQILGTVYPIKASISPLKESGGYILMISSLLAFYGLPRYSVYAIGKVAQTALAQSLSFEFDDTGIDIGVAYVCFVKNEADKVMILPDGKTSTLTERPGKMQFSREKVAQILANTIRKRKKRLVMSFYGKFYDLCSRIFPSFIRFVMKRKLPL